MPARWILIDGNNSVHRDFHAAGIERIETLWRARLRAFIERFAPEFVITAFDGGRSWRYDLLPTYKGERKRPEFIDDAFKIARDVCFDESVDVVEVDTFEADDVIATMTRIGRRLGKQVVIYSADKDLHQLITEGEVLQLTRCLRKGKQLECGWFNSMDLFARYGVRHHQWIDYRAMIGDKSDNIDGVPGIGPETAARLLQSVGTLDAFYGNPWKANITPSMQAKLIAARPRIPVLRRLLTLVDGVPLGEGWEEMS